MNPVGNTNKKVSPDLGSPQIILGGPSPNSEVLSLVDKVPVMKSPDKIVQSIKKSEENDWKKISLKVLTFLSSAALGVLTGAAILGTMVTPVGWAIAGGALLIGVIGSVVYGGPEEFYDALKLSASGFIAGLGSGYGLGLMFGAGIGPLGIRPDMFLGGLAVFTAGLLTSGLVAIGGDLSGAEARTLQPVWLH